METQKRTRQGKIQKLIINRKHDFKTLNGRFNPRSLVNKILLESGVEEGKLATFKYMNGKLSIRNDKICFLD